MSNLEAVLWIIVAAVAAVALERLIAHFVRRDDQNNSRLRAAVESILIQRFRLDELFHNDRVEKPVKAYLIECSDAAFVKCGAHALLRLINDKRPAPGFEGTDEFLASAREMHKRDPKAYELYRTFIFGVQAMCFLQRPETFKSIGQLMLRMISENAPAAALDIGVMRHEVRGHEIKESVAA